MVPAAGRARHELMPHHDLEIDDGVADAVHVVRALQGGSSSCREGRVYRKDESLTEIRRARQDAGVHPERRPSMRVAPLVAILGALAFPVRAADRRHVRHHGGRLERGTESTGEEEEEEEAPRRPPPRDGRRGLQSRVPPEGHDAHLLRHDGRDGSRTEEPLLDVPVSTTVIGKQELETSPAQNYADLLRGVPASTWWQTVGARHELRGTGAHEHARHQPARARRRQVHLPGLLRLSSCGSAARQLDEVDRSSPRGPGSAVWGATRSRRRQRAHEPPRETPGGLFTAGPARSGRASRPSDGRRRFTKASYRVAASWYEQDAWPRSKTLPDGTLLPPDAAFANKGARQPKLTCATTGSPRTASAGRIAGLLGHGGHHAHGHRAFAIDPSTRMAYGEVSYERSFVDAKVYLNWLDGNATNLLNLLPFSFKTQTWVAEATIRGRSARGSSSSSAAT